MGDRSQLPRAYGEHWSPATVWELFGPCSCGAGAGEACWDRRVRHARPIACWKPHPGRPARDEVDGGS